MRAAGLTVGIALLFACGEPSERLYAVSGAPLDCAPLPIDGPFAVAVANEVSDRPDAMTLSWGHVGVRCGDLDGIGCLPGRVERGGQAYTVFLDGRARDGGMALEVAIQRDCLDPDLPCPDRCLAEGTRDFDPIDPQPKGQLPEPDGSCEDPANATGAEGGEPMQLEVYGLAGIEVRMSAVSPAGVPSAPTAIIPARVGRTPARATFDTRAGNLWEITSMDGACLRRIHLDTPLYVVGGERR